MIGVLYICQSAVCRTVYLQCLSVSPYCWNYTILRKTSSSVMSTNGNAIGNLSSGIIWPQWIEILWTNLYSTLSFNMNLCLIVWSWFCKSCVYLPFFHSINVQKTLSQVHACVFMVFSTHEINHKIISCLWGCMNSFILQ